MALKKGLGDLVIDKLHERRLLVRQKLAQQYKRTKPFRMEEVSTAEQLYDFNQLTPEAMAELRQQAGNEAVDAYIASMTKLQARYKGE